MSKMNMFDRIMAGGKKLLSEKLAVEQARKQQKPIQKKADLENVIVISDGADKSRSGSSPKLDNPDKSRSGSRIQYG